jgi:transposase
MIRTHLSAEQRSTLQTLRHDRSLTPAERDRVEMLFLSDAGWSPPRIAAHLGYCAATVRSVLARFPASGTAQLRRRPPGPPPALAQRRAVEAVLTELVSEDRTWTAGQLAEALTARGFPLRTRSVRRYLGRMGARYRRTVRTLDHKQDPERVATAEAELAALKAKPKRGTSRSLSWTSVASAPASR